MTDMPNWIPVAVRRRGGRVETVHRGAAVAVDPSGKTLLAAGDPASPTFFRSSVKMYQALPMVKSGAPEKFGAFIRGENERWAKVIAETGIKAE